MSREVKPLDVSKIKRIPIKDHPKFVELIPITKEEESAFQKIAKAMPYYILVYGEEYLNKLRDNVPLPAPLNMILKYTGQAISYVAKKIGVKP